MASIIPGSPIFRAALKGEASLNILAALPLILAPSKSLSLILADPSVKSATGHLQLVQLLGVLFAGLAIPLLQASAETPQGVALRKPIYLHLGVMEVLIIAILAPQLAFAEKSGAIDPIAIVGLLGVVGGALAWRIYSTLVRPDFAGWVISTSEYRKQQ